MHLGRSHHTGVQVALSTIAGFTTSFLVVLASSTSDIGGMKGQVVAGNQLTNRQLPTTLNAFRGAIDGSNPIMHSLTSYGFWITVILGGIVMSFVLLRVVRRFV